MHYMRSWDGHGRELAKTHMQIRQDPAAMLDTLREWDERLRDKEFLRRVTGWVNTTRTWNGQHLFLTHQSHERGRLVRETIAASPIGVGTQTLICGLPLRTLDKFMREFKPRNAHDPYQLQERAETLIYKITAGRMSDDPV